MVRKKIYINKEVKAVVSNYKNLLKKEGVKFDKIYLFGSYAKHCPRFWSDIDVAVVSKNFGRDFVKEQVSLDRIADKISYAIEPHPFHPQDLRDKWSTLAFEIKKYGKAI